MDLYGIVYACVEYHKSRDAQQQVAFAGTRAHPTASAPPVRRVRGPTRANPSLTAFG